MALAHAFDIFHLPTLLLFVDGQYHGQLHSPMQRQAINTALEQLLAARRAKNPEAAVTEGCPQAALFVTATTQRLTNRYCLARSRGTLAGAVASLTD
jgi:thioredoxin-like negative regulator of GroEL